MKNNNNKIKKKLLALLIVFTLLLSSSSFINNSNLFTNLNLSTIQEEDISVEWGDNVYQNLPYWYSGTFYDDADIEFDWTTARIDFEYIPDDSITYSHSITDLDNSETQYPLNSSFSMVDGTHYQNGTLNAVDDDYHIFNSTYDRVIAEQPFTIGAGNSTYDGDLEFLDGNYTTFNSTESLGGGVYPATYTFTNDITGGLPADWVSFEGSGCDVEVLEELGGHSKIVELYDGGSSTTAYTITHNEFEIVENGTIEMWLRFDGVDEHRYVQLFNDSSLAIGTSILMVSGGNFLDANSEILQAYVNDQWYHIKIEFDCSDDTFSIWIDDVLRTDTGTIPVDFTTIKILRFATRGWANINYYLYIDAVGYSWDLDYNIGDNLYVLLSDLNFTVDLNLNEFSSLEDLSVVYSYRTNISQTCNFSIYNFDDSVYDVIENDVNLVFVNSYFLVNSSYYNATNDMILSFVMSNNTSDFEMRLDRLLVRKPSYLNFSTSVNFGVITGLLRMNIESYQRSNITQLINMSIWSYVLSSWVNLNSSSYITTFQLLQWVSTTFSDYIDSNGDVSLNYYGVNITDAFRFELDGLSFKIWRKTIVQYEKILSLLGTWKYRFVLDIGLGTSYNSSWIYFNIIVAIPNFHAISESDQTTRWILQGAEISPVEDFHDDLTINTWDLDGVSERIMVISRVPTDDAHVHSYEPTINFGAWTYLWLTMSGTYYRYGYLKYEIPYLIENYTQNSVLKYYISSQSNPSGNLNFYYTSDFDESTIIWNNKPVLGAYISTTNIPLSAGNVYYESDLGVPYNYYGMKGDASTFFKLASKESSLDPYIAHYLSKNYQGGGHIYMQTNTTETISLKSQDYGTHKTLNSGDYFKLNFQTNSDSQIDLILLKDGVVQKTLTLSQSGNTNFNNQIIKISVDESVEFDQLKISGTLEDADYVKVNDIKTYKYTLTGESADFYADPDGSESVYLSPDNYNLRIYEGGYEKINENITIGSTDYYHVYKPIEAIECRITLFSLEGAYLQFTDYHITVNRSLNEEYNQFSLVNTLFYADEETYVYIEVSDRFDALIDSFERLTSDYMDLYIEVYSLKIRNEATEIVDYTLQNTDTGSSKSGTLFSDEIVEYHVKSGDYSLDYTNYEDMYPREYNFELTTHKTISINSTYHTVYIGLFTYDGLGLNRDWVRLYINDVRADFGFNVIDSETANLTVLDYFNNTLESVIIDASAYSEYNLYVQVYSMYILNQFTYSDLIMNITQVDSGIYMNQLIPASSALLYRFIPDINYTISVTYVNGTVYSIRTVNLTDNSQIESFGVPLTPSEYPKDVYFGVYTTTGLGIVRDLLRFYIDGDRTDFGFNRITDMIITLVVKDYFNTTLFNQNVNTSGIYEYNILITLYSLKVKNEARVSANYTLKLGGLETTGYILPEEIIEYQLSSNNYVFDYTNNEDNSFHTININLNQDRVYVLSSTYYDTYFSLYDQNGVRLDDSLFSLYLNGTRKDFGFVELESTDVLVVVQDYLNFTVFNSIVALSNFTEYNIIITVFELQIRHLAQENSNLTLYETTTHNHINFSMSPDSLNKYVLSDSIYNITWVNGENGLTTVYDITLDENYILTLNTTYYNIFFSLYDVNLHIINPYQYEFRLNETIQDFGSIMDLQTDDYNITVIDRFGTYLFNSIVNLRSLNEYRIDISLHELQISHLARYNSNLTLTEDISGNDYLFIMVPYSIKSIVVGSADYTLGWTNGENGLTTSISIALTEDRVVMLNTSYYNTYFSLYDVNLHIINPYQYEFRLNGTIQDFGLIVDLSTDDYNITVIDRFGTYLFNSIVNLRGLNEYRIDISLHELQISHLARYNSNVSLCETTSHNGLNFSMAPDSLRSFILGSSTYNITWLNNENGITTTYNINLNLDYILTLDTTYYDTYFSLYDQGGVRLDDSLFSLYVNTTRKDFGFVKLESNSTLIVVQDYLNVTVFNQAIGLRGLAEYNIIITVFEFQIRHLAFENSNLTLYETTTHNHINFSMSPDSLNKYVLSNSTYNITWVNGENLVSTLYNITLNKNYILTLDSTYFDVYFSTFNYDGLGLDNNLFRFYINGLRKDFGFNTLKQDTNNLKVLDYFNATLFDSNIALKQYTEYNLFVEVYALIINNNYSFSIKIEIEREGIDIDFEQIIGAQFGVPYRFLPNIEYYIKAYHLNGTLLDERIVELDSNNKIVSFGFYSEEIPVIPDFNAPGIWLMIILILMACGFAIAFIGYLAYRYRKKSENYRRSYADKVTLEAQTIKKFSQGTRIR